MPHACSLHCDEDKPRDRLLSVSVGSEEEALEEGEEKHHTFVFNVYTARVWWAPAALL